MSEENNIDERDDDQKRSLELLNAWLDLAPEERRKIDEAGMVHTRTEMLDGKPVKCYREV